MDKLRYQDLARELKRLWKVEITCKVIPIVIGALTAMAKGLEKNMKKVGSNATVEFASKSCTPRNIANSEKGTRLGQG